MELGPLVSYGGHLNLADVPRHPLCNPEQDGMKNLRLCPIENVMGMRVFQTSWKNSLVILRRQDHPVFPLRSEMTLVIISRWHA